MSRKGMIVLVVLMTVVALGTTACGKKKAKQAPDMDIQASTVDVPTEDVSQAAPPEPQDQTPDPWSEDLQTVTSMAHEQGLIGDVYYDFDQYDLRPEARERLAKNASFMQEHPEFVFTIEGHCDERGTNEYNLALGDRRAAAAKDYLVSLGISSDRLRTVSYGEERPFCNQSDESCWQQNRRAHFTVTGRAALG
jgi:peptidoglycan-associated lipoprotein